MAIMGMSVHDIFRVIMLFLGALMVFLNFVLSAAALDKINSSRGMLKDVIPKAVPLDLTVTTPES